MSNDTDYKLIFGHPKREYLEQVMNHLIEKKERYEQKKPEKIPLQQHLKDLGLNRPADFVSWGFSFGKITKAGTFQTVEATTWANENSSNVHITGEDGELASLLNVFTELDISGSYRDEYSAGSIQGYEKVQEQSREEVDAEEAEWGSDDYSEATKTLLNKTYHGPFGLKEARQLIEEGADLNASMNGTCFGGMLADPGWELYKAIPEFLEKGMEMQTIGYLHPDLARALAKKYVDFELGGLFHLDTNTAKILVEEVSKRQPPKDEVFLLNLSLSEISEELAEVLAQFPGILGLDLQEMGESLAEILGAHRGTLSLGLQELDLKAAQALVAKAREQSSDGLALTLYSLKEGVSLDVAKVLANYPGDLTLRLTDLDASLAAALASHKGALTFNELGCYSGSGVFELDERTAAELGKHHGPIHIMLLRYLSAKSASGLAKNTHGLYNQDVGTWNRQTDVPNEFHDEGGVFYRCNIDNHVLAELMKCTGEVMLGIDHLNPEQAKICASHPGTLWLPYLRRLQPKAACCLAKKAGNLNLSGLEELSDEICEYFSDFPFTLSLKNLEKVSPEGLQSLTRLHNAPEPAGICAPALFGMNQTKGAPTTSHKPEEEKERLALRTIPTSFYYAEGENPQGPFSAAHILSLKSLGKISDETYVIQTGGTEWTTFATLQPTLKSLLPGPVISSQSPHPNPIAVATSVGIEKEASPAMLEASPTKAAALGPNASFTEQMLALARSLDTPENRLDQLAKGISNNWNIEVPDIIKTLRTFEGKDFKGGLFLNRVSSITEDLASLLTKIAIHDDNTVCLNGLDDLPAEFAAVLAKCRGSLILGGFQEISLEAAKALSEHKGPLVLSSLNHITDDIALALSKIRFRLELDGLEEIDPQTARGLAASADLQLDGLTILEEDVAKELSNHKGPLALRGLKALGVRAAEHLARRSVDFAKLPPDYPPNNPTTLILSLEEFSPDLARAFLASKENIDFLGLNTISEEILLILKERSNISGFPFIEFLSSKAKEILGSGIGKHFDILIDWKEIEVKE